MVIHATEGPKKIMVETVMLRGTAELPALCYYAKKGRIFIKVRMVYHVKLLKIDGKKKSLTWAYYANWIFNPVMVVLATLFLDQLTSFEKMRDDHVKSSYFGIWSFPSWAIYHWFLTRLMFLHGLYQTFLNSLGFLTKRATLGFFIFQISGFYMGRDFFQKNDYHNFF